MKNKKWFRFAAASALAIGLGYGVLKAQGPGPGMLGHGPRGKHIAEFIAAYLDLTEAQKAQAAAIFQASRTANEPLATQLKQLHANVTAAVKAGKPESEIRQLAATSGPLVGQVAAVLRRMRKPDPYQQKGVRYTGERLKKKAGKTGAKA